MPAIETTALTKVYDEDVVAVDELDLTVEEGEVYGFLGPNGAGKSTTINVLLDFARPTSGSASVLGRDPREDAQEIRRRTGVLPEGASLYDRLTGREHLEWFGRANDVDPDVEGLLDTVGLTADEADRPVGGYSKGMQQRLAFSMALLGDPDLLILDEPSTGLDPTGMQEMREIIREQAAAGKTVFFSSHILGEVESVCDRIGIMHQGDLVAVGTQDELQEELDLEATITVEVGSVPEPAAVEAIAGVTQVDVDGATDAADVDGTADAANVDGAAGADGDGPPTVRARVVDPATKVDVVRTLDERTQVLDILSEDTSLEQLFNTYTGNGRTGGDDADGDGAPGNAGESTAVAEVSR